MLFTYSNNTIKIDNNDHYFIGKVDKSIFPEIIREEYEEIIQKSFDNYVNIDMSVENVFQDPHQEYVINFSYHSKPIFFNTSIKIPLEKHQKDFKDYMNERMVKLEEQVATLTLKLESLSPQLINDTKTVKSVKYLSEDDCDESEEEIDRPLPRPLPKVKAVVTSKKH
jgi:hypothetical protein